MPKVNPSAPRLSTKMSKIVLMPVANNNHKKKATAQRRSRLVGLTKSQGATIVMKLLGGQSLKLRCRDPQCESWATLSRNFGSPQSRAVALSMKLIVSLFVRNSPVKINKSESFSRCSCAVPRAAPSPSASSIPPRSAHTAPLSRIIITVLSRFDPA